MIIFANNSSKVHYKTIRAVVYAGSALKILAILNNLH